MRGRINVVSCNTWVPAPKKSKLLIAFCTEFQKNRWECDTSVKMRREWMMSAAVVQPTVTVHSKCPRFPQETKKCQHRSDLERPAWPRREKGNVNDETVTAGGDPAWSSSYLMRVDAAETRRQHRIPTNHLPPKQSPLRWQQGLTTLHETTLRT